MSIGPVGATPFVPPSISTGGAGGIGGGLASGGIGGGARAAGQSAASAFAEKLDQVSGLTKEADRLATGVATGSVDDVHRFTTAAAKAQLGVELTVALRNKAVEAYQDIMRMQV